MDAVSRNGQRTEVAPPNYGEVMNDETLMKLQNAEDRISSLLKLPPPHSSWSHQRTVEFKECCKKAMNYMNRKRKNLDQLVDLEKQIRTYF